jgi:hypothetical protein
METLKNATATKFEDEFGNIIQEFEVIEYDKRVNGEWIEEKRYKVEGHILILMVNYT